MANNRICLLYSTPLFVLFLFYNNSSFGQWSVGLEGGITNNVLLTNISNRPQSAYGELNGFYLGITGSYACSNFLSILVHPSYLQKNYIINSTDNYIDS